MHNADNGEKSGHPEGEKEGVVVNGDSNHQRSEKTELLYGVDDVPPWYLCIFLGFQHYLTAFGSTLTVPLVLYTPLCMDKDTVGLSMLISTIFFVSGVVTVIQTSVGIRKRL